MNHKLENACVYGVWKYRLSDLNNFQDLNFFNQIEISIQLLFYSHVAASFNSAIIV